MAKNTANYGNDSIRQLKDEERVRLRPAVIFGSDGLDGCAHAAFEILSNAVDEARQGYGKLITLTAFRDGSIQVEDNGRGCPLDWNPSEKRFNWELVFCELRRWQVPQQPGRRLRHLALHQRLGLLRNSVRFRVHGSHRLA